MTEDEFSERTMELIQSMRLNLFARVLEKVNSGAVDLENYENDYRLPKIVLTSVLNEARHWYKPTSEADLEELDNLDNF